MTFLGVANEGAVMAISNIAIETYIDSFLVVHVDSRITRNHRVSLGVESPIGRVACREESVRSIS